MPPSMLAIWWKTFGGHRSFAAGIMEKCNSATLRTSECGTINAKLYKYFMSESPNALVPKCDFVSCKILSGDKPPLLSLIKVRTQVRKDLHLVRGHVCGRVQIILIDNCQP